jgi:hypothetical protein
MAHIEPRHLVLALAACSSSSVTPDAPGSLRPGVEDSSQAYKGTPNAHETAFWTAVRDADDVARAAAVEQLVADVAADPTNGYSEFLIGASSFMPPRATLAALAAGTRPAPFQPSADGEPFLRQGIANLTDPFYLGFDEALLAGLQFIAGDPQALTTAVSAFGHNRVATGFFLILQDLAMLEDPPKALTDTYSLLEYCNGGPLDRAGGDAASFGAKQTAGTLRQRECYSGAFAPHGSSGLLFLVGDLHALNGNAAAARAYYAAVQRTTDYATWPLKPVVERRLAPGAAAPTLGELTGIATTCGTCHVDQLR